MKPQRLLFSAVLSVLSLNLLALPMLLTMSTAAADYPPPMAQNPQQYPPAANTAPIQSAPARPRVPMAPNMPQPRFNANAMPRNYAAPRVNPYARQQYPRAYNNRYPAYPLNRQYAPYRNYGGNNNYANRMPYRNNTTRNNNFMPFSGGNMPFMNNGGNNSFGGFPTNPMNNMFGNNKGGSMPFFNQTNNKKKRKKAWGDKRNIWPDFYTDFTDESWDTMSSGPRDLGEMPGGWHFPLISTPDPVTVSDAIANQFPPFAEEAGNMMDFSDWGLFDNK